MNTGFTQELLIRSVQGDFEAFAILLNQSHEEIQRCRKALSELVLTTDIVRKVLIMLQKHEVSTDLVQKWASFIRRGYLTGSHSAVLFPIDISYEASSEERIADVISRLDEIGDLLNGEIHNNELATLIESLSE